MTTRLEQLDMMLKKNLDKKVRNSTLAFDELTIIIARADYQESMQVMHDSPDLCFEEMIDLCGVDYSGYANGKYEGPKFAVVVHLLSLKYNWRIRVKVFIPDEDTLRIPTISTIWPAADWYEREAFDLFGIHFDGHPDLRRILTDYGFVGHPLRKDFPVHGYVEMRYDETEGKIIYEPVTIEQREITPRVIREDDYGKRS